VILFNYVVEILDLSDLDSRVMVGVVTYVRRRVGAALRSRLAVSRKSTVAPALSTVRYKYFHAPLTVSDALRPYDFVCDFWVRVWSTVSSTRA
jgi:hypothetical protein